MRARLATTLRIVTRSDRLAGDAFTATRGMARVERTEIGVFVVEYGWPRPEAAAVLKVLDAVRRRIGRWVLPERTEADEAWDAAPLDLANKRWMLAGVARVTETDQQILIPLVPATDGPNPTLEAAVHDVLALCRRGYPWRGAARDWMEPFLQPAALKALDREFGA